MINCDFKTSFEYPGTKAGQVPVFEPEFAGKWCSITVKKMSPDPDRQQWPEGESIYDGI